MTARTLDDGYKVRITEMDDGDRIDALIDDVRSIKTTVERIDTRLDEQDEYRGRVLAALARIEGRGSIHEEQLAATTTLAQSALRRASISTGVLVGVVAAAWKLYDFLYPFLHKGLP